MAFEDIERLKEKVERDPSSKLFVALAEEYKKIGMLDEAIEILINGLERLPRYMSARVSLGKIYLEKGMLDEASAEFEQVVSAIPDNLYAHKKLAEIYRDLNETDKAIREFKTLLDLNPEDIEAAKDLAVLEGGGTAQQRRKRAEEMPKEEKVSDISTSEGFLRESGVSNLGAEEELGEERAESEQKFSTEEVFQESRVALQPQVRIEDAESYISQGRYNEALDVYEKLISMEPDNLSVLQRMEELKILLKLLGNDKELITRLNGFLDSIKKRREEFLRDL